MAARYRANQAALNQMLHGRNGPVVLHMANKGREARGHAKRLVGTDSMDLYKTINFRIVRSNPGHNVEIFAGNTPKTAKYVMAHHDGARPHTIRPRRKKALKFSMGGETVFAKKVNHPGNKSNKFLLRGAQAAGLRVRRR